MMEDGKMYCIMVSKHKYRELHNIGNTYIHTNVGNIYIIYNALTLEHTNMDSSPRSLQIHETVRNVLININEDAISRCLEWTQIL